jgi:hypothetical protein
MSAPAPITFNIVRDKLPEELQDVVMSDLDGPALLEESKQSLEARKQVQAHYLMQYPETPGLVQTYDASQPPETVFSQPRSKQYLKDRAVSLADKTKRLVGGPGLIDRVADNSSQLYPGSQAAMAAARWNCKVVGLIPFLRKIPAARDCLTQVAQTQSDMEKFVVMEGWIKTHPVDVNRLAQIEIIRCRAQDVQVYVKPIFYALQGKVYNLLPKAIKHFTGLQKLSLYNNFLSEVPIEITALPLLELNLGANYLKTMPPAIPSLRRLSIVQNQNEFAFEDVAAYINTYIQKGGEYIQIILDRPYCEDPQYQELIDLVASRGTHILRLELKDGQSVFTVEKVLDATQPL